MKREHILEVKNLTKTFKSSGRMVEAVSDVSFSLAKGETLAIVGESGCGKTTTGRMVMQLTQADKGEICFNGQDLNKLSKKELRPIRPSMQIIFQDPFGALNPRMTVYQLLSEAIQVNGVLPKIELKAKCEKLLKSVELQVADLDKYPHEFSGGQRQRLVIARAIATKPQMVVCDEPVSALDLLVQAQILNLLKNVQKELGYSCLFISHDLSVVKHMSDRIAIMYFGKIVEIGTTEEIFKAPGHPYTKLLLSSMLSLDREMVLTKSDEAWDQIASNNNSDSCKFSEKCSQKDKDCVYFDRNLRQISETHYVACEKWKTATQ